MINATQISIVAFVCGLVLFGVWGQSEAEPARAAKLYVAVNGRDDWSGTLAGALRMLTVGLTLPTTICF